MADSTGIPAAPPDYIAIEGQYDHLSQRIDLSGEHPAVIDYQPPSPSPDHEWNAQTRRWQLNAAAAGRAFAHDFALAQIVALEATQHRAVREVMLGDAASLERLREIEAQLVALRAHLIGQN